MNISANFSCPAMSALSWESASSPPNADSSMEGRMKMPIASVTFEPTSLPPKRNRISITSIWRTKLSLNAERNWHQNSGAKRREAINPPNIPPPRATALLSSASSRNYDNGRSEMIGRLHEALRGLRRESRNLRAAVGGNSLKIRMALGVHRPIAAADADVEIARKSVVDFAFGLEAVPSRA